MGDKGQKDKDKDQKQKVIQHDKDAATKKSKQDGASANEEHS